MAFLADKRIIFWDAVGKVARAGIHVDAKNLAPKNEGVLRKVQRVVRLAAVAKGDV